jgi:hypothetical protein
MSENRVLRRIFGPKKDEVTGEWRKLHNEELHNLYSLSDIFRLIKSRRMRWTEHVACMVDRRGAYRVLVRKPEGKRVLVRPMHRLGIIIRWICRKWEVGIWTGLIWLRIGTGGGPL